jgi:glutamyl-tRNA reductase
VDDLQGMVSELQQARRKNRLKNVSLLEEQMHQMLREWKAELREASPAFYCW